MSTIQEIEVALSRLSVTELEKIERKIVELKSHPATEDPCAYAMREYGVTREELERFDRKIQARLDEEEKAGTLRPFTGDIERDSAD